MRSEPRLAAFRRYQNDLALFSRDVVGVPLWAYQSEWANYALEVVGSGYDETIVVEMARQSGKNETSAQLEAAILARYAATGGSMVKCAPTWKPQIVNSKLRLEARAGAVQQKLPFLKFKPSMGYLYKCLNAVIQFLSAAPEANVVGATASLLLEVDEAQDVAATKYDKDFAPMRASTGAPAIFYGTPWTDTTLLEQMKLAVLEARIPGRVFSVGWERVAEENAAYGRFVEREMGRLGREHPLIRTQYRMELLPEAGRLLGAQQIAIMVGDHPRRERRSEEKWIVAGLDFAGGTGETGDWRLEINSRDSVALTIGKMTLVRIADGLDVPLVRMLARYEWVDVAADVLHTALYRILWTQWKVDRVHCDATGVGSAAAQFLAAALNKGSVDHVIAVTFDGAWQTHSRLAYNYLALVNGGRLTDYRLETGDWGPGGSPETAGRRLETRDLRSETRNWDPLRVAKADAPPADVDGHAWWQRGHARLQTRPEQRVKVHVPTNEGHDDLLISELLLIDAVFALVEARPSRVTVGGH